MKNDEPKYAIDDYKENKNSVNQNWFLWRKQKSYFKVGQIAICLVRIYDTDEWLLTSIKRITKDLGTYSDIGQKSFEGEEYKQYYGKLLLKYHKTFQASCVNYKTVCNRLEVVDTNYII